jgi:hypothetical protein
VEIYDAGLTGTVMHITHRRDEAPVLWPNCVVLVS